MKKIIQGRRQLFLCFFVFLSHYSENSTSTCTCIVMSIHMCISCVNAVLDFVDVHVLYDVATFFCDVMYSSLTQICDVHAPLRRSGLLASSRRHRKTS